VGNTSAGREGLTINFPIYRKASPRETTQIISETLKTNQVDWLQYEKPRWKFFTEKFKHYFSSFENESWLEGELTLELEHETNIEIAFNKPSERSYGRFVITSEFVREQLPKKIFLSHKGIDKPLIRRFKSALESVGFDTWLDEDAMVAGAELERSLLKGFQNSCAAVFFVTPNYQDSGYLATEINYAMQQKREKGDRFAIITLALPDAAGNTGEIPDLLQQYVWKTPKSELEAYCEIIRALPLRISDPLWK